MDKKYFSERCTVYFQGKLCNDLQAILLFIKDSDLMVYALFTTSQTTNLDRLNLLFINQASVDLVRKTTGI